MPNKYSFSERGISNRYLYWTLEGRVINLFIILDNLLFDFFKLGACTNLIIIMIIMKRKRKERKNENEKF